MSFLDLLREPDIRVRMRTGASLGASSDGSQLVILFRQGGESPALGPYAADLEAANGLLAGGATLDKLRDEVIRAGGAQRAATYLVLLQRLNRLGILEYPLVDETGERAAILPQQESYVPALAPEAPPPEAGLDRFALLRRENGAWLLESPLSGARISMPDPSALEVPMVRRALAAAGFLETERPETDPRRDALVQWEFHDLVFHSHHRRGFHRDPFGGMFPYIGEIEPLPAERPPWPGERIPLAPAPNEKGDEPFAAVLERRRSERQYDESRPISLRDLGALFDRAARIRSKESIQVGNFMGRTAGFEVTRRPYPNGGASYELEIYPIVDRCDGLESGMYHYDAATHELVRITGRTPEVEQILSDANVATAFTATPQIVLAFTARFARVMWKYKSISYGVILRNTGALYQTFYLAATELGLSPCGIGSGNSLLFARASGLDPVIEGTVGDFILGGPPSAS